MADTHLFVFALFFFFFFLQYYEYYGPDFNLHIQPSNMENLNTPNYLTKQENALLQALKDMPHAPSVQYSLQPPRDEGHQAREEMEKARAEHESMRDTRMSGYSVDKHISDRREFYADDRDQDGSTVPEKIKPQLPSVLSATSTTIPSALTPTTTTTTPATSSSTSSSNIPFSINQASPPFQPNTNLTPAGAPAISAPMVTPSHNNSAAANRNAMEE